VTHFGIEEHIVVTMARQVRDDDLVGQGVNSVMASLAFALAKRTHAPNMVCVNIGGGVDVVPSPLPPSSVAPQWMRGTPVIISNADLYGHMFSGRFDLFFSSGVQIDARGRINITVIGDHRKPKVRLPGAGGLPVVFQTVKRIVLWRAKHTRTIFVEDVDFVSAAGNVTHVITPLCVFTMQGGRLALHQIFPGVDERTVRERTGFDFGIAPDGLSEVPPPTAEELRLIEEIDPHAYRRLEFK
jgi:glutaconate CoA-transferase subunit B